MRVTSDSEWSPYRPILPPGLDGLTVLAPVGRRACEPYVPHGCVCVFTEQHAQTAPRAAPRHLCDMPKIQKTLDKSLDKGYDIYNAGDGRTQTVSGAIKEKIRSRNE